jgi:membrane protein
MSPKELFNLSKESVTEFGEDKASRLGAAIAYYAVFAMAPLLVLAISIAGLVFGQEAAQGRIVGQISGAVGEDAAEIVMALGMGFVLMLSMVISTVVAP